MICNKALDKLDYHHVRERLANHCHLESARQKALTLLPVADFDQVWELLKETEEARDLLRVRPSFSVRGCKEIHNYLERCEYGGMIMGPELVDIKDTLYTARQTRDLIVRDSGFENRGYETGTTNSNLRRVNHEQRAEAGSILRHIAETIVPLRPLEEVLERSLSEEGEVTDRASAELAHIRGVIAKTRQRIKSALDQVLRQETYQKMIRDSIVTTRGERYVVPIKQEYMSAFPGIVHDQSASGATVFVEPIAVVEANNEIRVLRGKERGRTQFTPTIIFLIFF